MTGYLEGEPRAFEEHYERVVVVDEVAEGEHVMVPASDQTVTCQQILEEN